MSSTSRLLAAFAAGALVTVPGLALAESGLLTAAESSAETEETTESETETGTESETETGTESETESDGDGELGIQQDPEPEEEPLELQAEADADDADDDGHGEMISTLAECLPSGAELHGTGFTKGFVMSQAASTGQVVIEAHEIDATLESPEDATALCEDELAPIIEAAEAPDTAKGRPDWAGPKGDDEAEEIEEGELGDGDVELEGLEVEEPDAEEVEENDADRRGPPAHARAKGARGPKGGR